LPFHGQFFRPDGTIVQRQRITHHGCTDQRTNGLPKDRTHLYCGAGTWSCLQIAAATWFSISRWRGTLVCRFTCGLCQMLCLAPSRSRRHPWFRRCLSKSVRFIPPFRPELR
jgi:hypothetical protein